MKTVIIVIFIVLVVIFYVRYLEQSTVFHPSRDVRSSPKDINLVYEDLTLTASDQLKINGWFIPSENPSATLIFLHGNAGNMGDRLEKINMFHKLGLNVLIIDYRGYGKSQGHPSEEGMYLDSLAAYDYVISRPDVDKNKIIVYGSSLGGAPAINLASQRTAAALILDSTFSSAADMARKIFPFVPSFLIKTKLDSMPKIAKIKAPKLFIHSQQDEVVPYFFGRKLYEAAVGPKEFLEIKGTHEDALQYDAQRFVYGVTNFLKRYSLI